MGKKVDKLGVVQHVIPVFVHHILIIKIRNNFIDINNSIIDNDNNSNNNIIFNFNIDKLNGELIIVMKIIMITIIR